MAKIYSTEITSETLPSDNPIHQRLFKAYVAALEYIRGEVLEIGCGEGRGVETLLTGAERFTAVDKIEAALAELRTKFPQARFIAMNLPPLHGLPNCAYDVVVSFQVIEHIKDDQLFLREIYRVLKPGGVALVTTPNRKMSLTRNPWHVREYLAHELKTLALTVFQQVELKGIAGNEKVMAYYEQNRQAVQRLARWDIFNLQYKLPAWMLRIPYEWLNRLNRNNLQQADSRLVTSITHQDYVITDKPEDALDLFLVVQKG